MAIATRASRRGGTETPIQIQAQVLRDSLVCTPCGPLSGFAIIPEETARRPVEPAKRSGTGWRQRDAERAIEAAEHAGLTCYRVEITPDGTVSIVVGAP